MVWVCGGVLVVNVCVGFVLVGWECVAVVWVTLHASSDDQKGAHCHLPF